MIVLEITGLLLWRLFLLAVGGLLATLGGLETWIQGKNWQHYSQLPIPAEMHLFLSIYQVAILAIWAMIIAMLGAVSLFILCGAIGYALGLDDL